MQFVPANDHATTTAQVRTSDWSDLGRFVRKTTLTAVAEHFAMLGAQCDAAQAKACGSGRSAACDDDSEVAR